MGRYLLTRILQGILVILLISLFTFAIVRLIPGDPVDLLLGEGQVPITEAQVEAIRRQWGLDRPLWEQYLIWMGKMLTGSLGTSIIRTGVPVSRMIWEAVPVTALLNLLALGIALAVAIPAGIIAGSRRNSWFDYLFTAGTTLGVAVPNFWLGLMLIVLFGVVLRWLPPFGLRSWQGYILPVAVLATEQMAVLARVMRGAMIEILAQDYIKTARSKGLSYGAILFGHAVPNALLPVVTVIGFRIAFLLSGTLIIESVFALPGLGRLLYDSVFRLDYQVAQAIVMLLSILVVVVNLLTDLTYAAIDPRLRLLARSR
ncbi:ABC transporter permease [Thermostichus vulcanus]|uniref:ABC transporter permease n=1 Tax=Thermostichus vulcanus str. 'Rupite' TaxID=2813851 RepID=A0ABT0CB93_THEVL|nr:ABC transporter permease [Thermostichus vulcanus]MCJ2543045.1 ABC transporter permease [Thermostichus vulcanus str. 'Rupite']